jgi:hypothetical protein
MTTKLMVLLVLTVPCLLACSESERVNDSDKYIGAYCAEVAKCCGQDGLPSDGQTCKTDMSSAVAGASYNSTAGEACLAEIRAGVADGTYCASGGSSLGVSSVCSSVYQGGTTRRTGHQPGENCGFDYDCAKPAEGRAVCWTGFLQGVTVSKCQVVLPGAEGDTTCVGTQDGQLFAPDPDATDFLAQGYVCDTGQGLRCSAGVCVALTPVGDPCVLSTMCPDAPSCGLRACWGMGYCVLHSGCARSAYCDRSQNKCVAQIAAGGTCTGGQNDECVDGNLCLNSRCVAQGARGAFCSDFTMCLSGNCVGHACQGRWDSRCGQ